MKTISKLIVFYGAIFLFSFGWIAYSYDLHNPERIAFVLNLREPPSSLRVIDCETPFTTDVLVTCAISVAPKDFDLLLASFSFEENSVEYMSYNAAIPVGRSFKVATEYIAYPPPFLTKGHRRFKYGGHIRILADRQKKPSNR